eukprot:GHVO01017690.1.p1 GENE.GHVO01017690.1~~GHVO01017690.1.p1  ORF type:complete len:226 (-),score=18.63 GHVO01017690.1:97-774(-)
MRHKNWGDSTVASQSGLMSTSRRGIDTGAIFKTALDDREERLLSQLFQHEGSVVDIGTEATDSLIGDLADYGADAADYRDQPKALLPILSEGIWAPRTVPTGRTLWRDTIVGTALLLLLDELRLESAIGMRESCELLSIFDDVATECFMHYSTTRYPIKLEGSIREYKSVDGTWLFYIDKARIGLDRGLHVVVSDILKIIATDKESLLLKQKSRLGRPKKSRRTS